MSDQENYMQMLCEANTVRLGKSKVILEGQEVVLEDGIFSFWKSRGIDWEQTGGGTVGSILTVALTVCGVILGGLAGAIGKEVMSKGETETQKTVGGITALLGMATSLLSAVMGDKKIKKETAELLKTPMKERVKKYSPGRVVGAFAYQDFDQLNKSLRIGQGSDYLARSKQIVAYMMKLKKVAIKHSSIADDTKKKGYAKIVKRIDLQIQKYQHRVNKEKAKLAKKKAKNK